MKNLRSITSRALILVATVAAASCGGSNASSPAASYPVGGTLAGLATGQSVTLADNNTDALTVVGNGTFTFKTPVLQNGAYSITVTAQPAGQTCTVTGGTGSVYGSVSSVSVTCTDALFTISGTVTGLAPNAVITLQNNGGDNLPVSANGAFTFATSLPYNATFAVTLSKQPTTQGQSCVVANGFSVVTGNVTTVTVTCGPANQYVYVVDYGANNVSQYMIDNGGLLTPLATPSVKTGIAPVSIAIDPTYSYAYVTNYADGTVSQYSIPAGGVLTPLLSVAGTVPFFVGTVPTGISGSATPSGPTAIAVDPKGKFVYVLNTTDTLNGSVGTLSQFAIGTQGELTAVVTVAVANGMQPAPIAPAAAPPVLAGQIAIDPLDRFLLVSSPMNSSVSQFFIGADGTLTPLSAPTVAAGNMPIGIAISPGSSFVYAANAADSTLSQFSLGATGLAALNAPTVTSLGVSPAFVAIDPTGHYLYEADNNAGALGTVSQYTIGASGVLTAMTVPDVAAGNGPQGITVDLTGHYVYVADTIDNAVGQYVIGAAGSMTPGALTPNASAAAGTTPIAIAVAYGQ